MDRLLAVLVRMFVIAASFTDRTHPENGLKIGPEQPLRILLAGYNGARNTGADVRVGALIGQLNSVFGKESIQLSLMSLDPESSKPYLAENVHVIPFDTIFFNALRKACSQHDAIVICEGSMLKSKFANGLTLFLCQAAGTAKAQHKPCVAYGVEAGEMDAFVKRVARAMCSNVHIIARTAQSLQVIKELGLDGVLGTDSAWTFDSSSAREQAHDLLVQGGWDGNQPLLGIAPINPYCWPAKPSLGKVVVSALTGTWKHHYQKFYFLSWSPERERKYETYLHALARSVNAYCETHDCMPVIIGMEKLDAQACAKLAALLDRPSIPVLAENRDGFVISEVLKQLETLVTSRYHAAVLSMNHGVVPIAVSMDERLNNLFEEAEMPSPLLLSVDDEQLSEHLDDALAMEERSRATIAHALGRFVQTQASMCATMARQTRDIIERGIEARAAGTSSAAGPRKQHTGGGRTYTKRCLGQR